MAKELKELITPSSLNTLLSKVQITDTVSNSKVWNPALVQLRRLPERQPLNKGRDV